MAPPALIPRCRGGLTDQRIGDEMERPGDPTGMTFFPEQRWWSVVTPLTRESVRGARGFFAGIESVGCRRADSASRRAGS